MTTNTSLRPADAGATAGTPGFGVSRTSADLLFTFNFSLRPADAGAQPSSGTASVERPARSSWSSFVPDHTVPYGTVLWRDAFPGTSCQATIGVVPPGRAGRHFATASS